MSGIRSVNQEVLVGDFCKAEETDYSVGSICKLTK